MNLREYLKLRGAHANALTNAEAKAIGVDLRRGWVQRHANKIVPEPLVIALQNHSPDQGKKRAILKSAAKKVNGSGVQDWTRQHETREEKRRIKRQKRKQRREEEAVLMADVPPSLRKIRKPYERLPKDFLDSREWRELRYQVLKERGARCECCGGSAREGKVLHVDHVKPKSKFPELALMKSNLQVLCEDCNLGKGAWDKTDWRTEAAHNPELDARYEAIMASR